MSNHSEELLELLHGAELHSFNLFIHTVMYICRLVTENPTNIVKCQISDKYAWETKSSFSNFNIKLYKLLIIDL